MKRISGGMKAWTVFLCALLLQPWGAYRLLAADITPGYTFTSGEQNVTHTKLNNAASGTINTTFYSGKSSAGADPNTAFQILLRDTSLDVFKVSTLAAAFFDHSSLLSARTAKTAPVAGDGLFIMDSAAGNAYKQMTFSNALYAGAATGVPTNETRLPALVGGALGSFTLSNLIAAATSHLLPTNGDAFLVLRANGGSAIGKLSLQDMINGAAKATTNNSDGVTLVWDGQLRGLYESNRISGLTATNTSPLTNDSLEVLQGAAMKRLFLHDLRELMSIRSNNLQSVTVTGTNAFTGGGGWSNLWQFSGTQTNLAATITPRSANSQIMIRVTLHAEAGSATAHFRATRNGTAVGVGDDDAALRVEDSASLPTFPQFGTVAWEFLDSPASTSTLTYQVQCQASSGTTYINRNATDTSSTVNPRTISTITVEEIFR